MFMGSTLQKLKLHQTSPPSSPTPSPPPSLTHSLPLSLSLLFSAFSLICQKFPYQMQEKMSNPDILALLSQTSQAQPRDNAASIHTVVTCLFFSSSYNGDRSLVRVHVFLGVDFNFVQSIDNFND